jgi:hypothetical protein
MTMTTLVSTLTEPGTDLARCEAVIRQGQMGVFAMADAVAEIFDRYLWQKGSAYPSAEAYFAGTFELSRSAAYRLRELSTDRKDISGLPRADQLLQVHSDKVLSKVRKELGTDEVRAIWTQAAEQGGRITCELLERVKDTRAKAAREATFDADWEKFLQDESPENRLAREQKWDADEAADDDADAEPEQHDSEPEQDDADAAPVALLPPANCQHHNPLFPCRGKCKEGINQGDDRPNGWRHGESFCDYVERHEAEKADAEPAELDGDAELDEATASPKLRVR